jgi:hypothetical protein
VRRSIRFDAASPPSLQISSGERPSECKGKHVDVRLSRNTQRSRRRFLVSAAHAASAAALTPALLAADQAATATKPVRRPKIALIATVIRKLSHAQHFVDRFLEGYGWQGRHHHPAMDLVSLYVDQFPADDLSRERSRRHGVPIYPTIAEALTLGGSRLAVDGVVIIGEHGNYPRNEKRQTLFPRYRFFKEVVRVFETSGRAAPVFNDKHLSTDWDQCVQMVADSKRLGFAFLAGSSLPVTWRIPSVELPLDAPLQESVCIGYGGVDSYDFHGLECAQCMSERRAGGEVGIKSVQALRGSRVCDLLDDRPITRRLAFTALSRSHTCAAGVAGYTFCEPDMKWVRSHNGQPVGYFLEHRDGFRTSMLLLNSLVSDFTYAGSMGRPQNDVSCQMYLPMPTRVSLADFFDPLVNHIEGMMLSGVAPYAVERTLLTSGMTLACVESLFRGQTVVQTPQMAVRYRPRLESNYWRA